jgi:hypothetical protein
MGQQGLSVWTLDSLHRVFLDSEPEQARGWRLSVARGEYQTFQLGVRYGGPLSEVEAVPGPLRRGGAELPAGAVQVRWVGLVPLPLESPFDRAGAERPDLWPGWHPDPIVEVPPWSEGSAERSAAVHFCLHVPRNAAPGAYHGVVQVRVRGKTRFRLPLRVEVWPFEMPAPRFHVTNWFQPDCLTAFHRCEPWSERHWRLLELYARDMAEHRLNVIATPTLTGNFHNYNQMTLVGATRKRGGTYTFDFSRLQRWVELFDRHGFELFEMWHFAQQGSGATAPPLSIWDEAKRKHVSYEGLPVASPIYRQLMASFLQRLSRWLAQRKLMHRFLLHVYDEPQHETWAHYAELSSFFRRHAPNIAHLDAISTSGLITAFGADIDIPVPETPFFAEDAYYRERARTSEKPVWMYTCCGPWHPYANRFVCHPLLSTRILHWQAYTYHVRGYLHWGYNFWHRAGETPTGWAYADEVLLNPYREAPTSWPVGDACIVYPPPRWWEDRGPVSSLRYEAVREGLQDHTLLCLLEELTASGRSGAAATRGRRLLQRIHTEIAPDFTHHTRDADLLLRTRRELGRCISALA